MIQLYILVYIPGIFISITTLLQLIYAYIILFIYVHINR